MNFFLLKYKFEIMTFMTFAINFIMKLYHYITKWHYDFLIKQCKIILNFYFTCGINFVKRKKKSF